MSGARVREHVGVRLCFQGPCSHEHLAQDITPHRANALLIILGQAVLYIINDNPFAWGTRTLNVLIQTVLRGYDGAWISQHRVAPYVSGLNSDLPFHFRYGDRMARSTAKSETLRHDLRVVPLGTDRSLAVYS